MKSKYSHFSQIPLLGHLDLKESEYSHFSQILLGHCDLKESEYSHSSQISLLGPFDLKESVYSHFSQIPLPGYLVVLIIVTFTNSVCLRLTAINCLLYTCISTDQYNIGAAGE